MDSSQTTVTVELTLRVGQEPIAGELRSASESRPFVGWIALVRSIEDAMTVDPEESS